MKKVLHITGTMNRAGTEVMLMELMRHRPEGISFDFLVNYTPRRGIPMGDFDDEIKALGGRLFYVSSIGNSGPFLYTWRLKKTLKKIKPDIVHIHMKARSGLIAKTARKAGIKNIIVHSHSHPTILKGPVSGFFSKKELQWQKGMINRYADSLWGCSPEACTALFGKKREEEFRIIHNAINLQKFLNVAPEKAIEFRKELGIEEDTLLIGNAGRIIRQKNISFLLPVLAELQRKNIDFRFIFAGRAINGNYLHEVHQKIRDYGMEDKVSYLGLRNDIPVLMKALDVFAAPSLKEGFGIVALEAQAAGVPCLLYRGFPKNVDMGLGLVRFLNHFDPREWAENILELQKVRNRDKEEIKEKIRQSGFDSLLNSHLIYELYEQMS